MWGSFANAKATRIFFHEKKNISVYAIFIDQSFNDTLTNDIVSFEQLVQNVWEVPVLVLLFVALWFILRGDLF